jgi:hypothetical protein
MLDVDAVPQSWKAGSPDGFEDGFVEKELVG